MMIPLAVAAVLLGTAHVPILELRLKTYGSFEPGHLRAAKDIAERILASGGIRIAWQTCPVGDCSESTPGQSFVVVRLLPMAKASDASTGGEVVRNRGTMTTEVLVYLRRNQAMTERMQRSARARSVPVLATLVTGHVVGLTVAHEVGHALGLHHAATGPMKDEIDIDAVIAARMSSLRFRAAERDIMRQNLRRYHPNQ